MVEIEHDGGVVVGIGVDTCVGSGGSNDSVLVLEVSVGGPMNMMILTRTGADELVSLVLELKPGVSLLSIGGFCIALTAECQPFACSACWLCLVALDTTLLTRQAAGGPPVVHHDANGRGRGRGRVRGRGDVTWRSQGRQVLCDGQAAYKYQGIIAEAGTPKKLGRK